MTYFPILVKCNRQKASFKKLEISTVDKFIVSIQKSTDIDHRSDLVKLHKDIRNLNNFVTKYHSMLFEIAYELTNQRERIGIEVAFRNHVFKQKRFKSDMEHEIKQQLANKIQSLSRVGSVRFSDQNLVRSITSLEDRQAREADARQEKERSQEAASLSPSNKRPPGADTDKGSFTVS